MSDEEFIQQTVNLAIKNVKEGGRPFACLIVKDGKVLKAAQNLVAQTNDPTGKKKKKKIFKKLHHQPTQKLLRSENSALN